MTNAEEQLQAADAFDATVGAQMEAIEQELVTAVETSDPILSSAARHLISAGGKRFRPQLVVLASKFGPGPDGSGAPENEVTNGAMIVELSHVASLYHDDVMDDATLRRGKPSANAAWGNAMAILVGDYLFSRAAGLATEMDLEIIKLNARMFNRLVRGQIAETVGPANGVDPLDHYLQVVRDKTACLIATSTEIGAMVACATPETTRLLADFGERLGICFQLSDDILDITSDEAGKTPGTDLREGVDTLPTLLAKRSTDPADARLLELLADQTGNSGLAAGPREGHDQFDDRPRQHQPAPRRGESDVEEALQLLRQHPAIGQARNDVAERADAALGVLDPLPEGPAKDALAELCDMVVTRTA